MSVPSTVRTLLDWQQGRRAGGVPTVTVLAGPINLSLRSWRGWAGRRPVTVVRAGSDADAAAAWAADLLSTSSGIDQVRVWLARVTGRDLAAVVQATDRLTRYDLEQLWRSLPIDPRSAVARAAFLLLAARAAETCPGPAGIVRSLSGGEGAEPVGAFRGLCGLYPENQWPALLLVPAAGDRPGWLARAASFLEAVAVAVPILPVAVAATRAVCDALAADTRSHTAAVLREGLIAVDGLTEADLEARLRAAGVQPVPDAATLRRLVGDGLDEAAAAAYVAAARAVRSPTPADLDSDFRSVHEEFLFDQLEAMPETAGLFRPNAPLPFRHGTQDAEADLLAQSLNLVVEVDGGYYHLTQTQYRRDRRKDWLYQRHGYLVLRFLAEDVVADWETILTTILEAVAFRRGHILPGGEPP